MDVYNPCDHCKRKPDCDDCRFAALEEKWEKCQAAYALLGEALEPQRQPEDLIRVPVVPVSVLATVVDDDRLAEDVRRQLRDVLLPREQLDALLAAEPHKTCTDQTRKEHLRACAQLSRLRAQQKEKP